MAQRRIWHNDEKIANKLSYNRPDMTIQSKISGGSTGSLPIWLELSSVSLSISFAFRFHPHLPPFLADFFFSAAFSALVKASSAVRSNLCLRDTQKPFLCSF